MVLGVLRSRRRAEFERQARKIWVSYLMTHYLRIGALSKKVGIVSLSKLFSSLNFFLINIIFARALTKEMNGSYQQTMLIINLFSTLFLFGVPTSIYYFLPNLQGGRKKGFFYQSVLILSYLGVITTIAAFFLSDWLAVKFTNPPLASLIRASCLYLLFVLAASFGDAILIAINRHALMAGLSILFTALHFAAVVMPVLFHMPMQSIFYLLGVVNVARFIVSFVVCRRLVSPEPPVFSSSLLREQFIYILPIGLNSMIDILSCGLDRILVSFLFTVKDLAVYQYGAQEIPFISILIGSISAVIIPEISRLRHEGRWDEFSTLFRNASVKTALILFPLFGFLMIFAQKIYIILYTESYLAAVPVFRIYLLMLPLRIVSYQSILFALGKTKSVIVGAAFDLVANLTLSLILAAKMGPVGVALGLVIATIGQVVFYIFIIRHATRIEWRRLFEPRIFGIIIVSCLVACIPCLIITRIPINVLVQVVSGAVICGAVYILCLRLLFVHQRRIWS